MNSQFTNFKAKLTTAFKNMPKLVTEDLIRHWFIEEQGLTITNTTIEKPYRDLLNKKSKFYSALNNRARADLYYQENGNKGVVELKYHKRVETSATCKTTNMGEVFRDLNRLSTLDVKEKYFIYVFDKEMKEYYDKHDATFLKIGNSLPVNVPQDINNFLNNAPGEFYKIAFSSFSDDYQDFSKFNYTVKVLLLDIMIDNEFYLLILQVD